MGKRDLGSVQANLAELAGTMPTRTVPARKGKGARSTPAAPSEELTQFSLSLRKSLQKELAQLALNEDMTMRAFVLKALKGKGLSVTEEDLKDDVWMINLVVPVIGSSKQARLTFRDNRLIRIQIVAILY